ncbi:MAG: NAD(P)-dependent oxidoreductase [Bacteroidales bacterium]|nr:NAD(P)-dependent oxidoreductase [Bacteroidales bacterium]MDD4209497.1 NAD(P)-dependent oxidoreductase [Bacteroidales bacterium]
MRVAVSGASGFLGKYLTKHLFDLGYSVLVLARPEEKASQCFDAQVSVYETDYSIDSLTKGLKKTDILIHLAAQTMTRETHPLKVSEFLHVNVELTENVLMAAELCNIKTVCQMSSNSVYSSLNTLPFRENEKPMPANVYGLSKLYAEQLGEFYNAKTKMNVISLRLARLFGYGERDTVSFTKFIQRSLLKQSIEIWGKGSTSIEYLYVKDAVDVIEKSIRYPIKGGIYNVGVNRMYSVCEIAEVIADVFDNKGNIVFLPEKQENGHSILMDSSLLNHTLQWQAQWQLKEAVEDILTYYK